MLVQHHRKYKELHGIDEIVMMDADEHHQLHKRLRREGNCNIPLKELHKISCAAYKRTKKSKVEDKIYREMYRKVISFCERVDTNINLLEQIEYNSSSGNVSYTSRFQKGYHKEIIFIDLV